jgi:uncharacterized membrane protein
MSLTLTNTLFGSIFIIIIDMIYLSLNKNLYNPILEPNIDINYTSAVVCWIIIVIAIQLLVLSRTELTDHNVLLYGAFLGFAMYGVYNATNFATYPNKWNIKIATIDTLWGTFLTSLTSYFLYKIIK